MRATRFELEGSNILLHLATSLLLIYAFLGQITDAHIEGKNCCKAAELQAQNEATVRALYAALEAKQGRAASYKGRIVVLLIFLVAIIVCLMFSVDKQHTGHLASQHAAEKRIHELETRVSALEKRLDDVMNHQLNDTASERANGQRIDDLEARLDVRDVTFGGRLNDVEARVEDAVRVALSQMESAWTKGLEAMRQDMMKLLAMGKHHKEKGRQLPTPVGAVPAGSLQFKGASYPLEAQDKGRTLIRVGHHSDLAAYTVCEPQMRRRGSDRVFWRMRVVSTDSGVALGVLARAYEGSRPYFYGIVGRWERAFFKYGQVIELKDGDVVTIMLDYEKGHLSFFVGDAKEAIAVTRNLPLGPEAVYEVVAYLDNLGESVEIVQ